MKSNNKWKRIYKKHEHNHKYFFPTLQKSNLVNISTINMVQTFLSRVV